MKGRSNVSSRMAASVSRLSFQSLCHTRRNFSITARKLSSSSSSEATGSYLSLSPQHLRLLTLPQLQNAMLQSGRRRARDNHHDLTLVMDELITRNDARKWRLQRDAVYLSYAAGLYSRCTEVYLATSAMMLREQSHSSNDNNNSSTGPSSSSASSVSTPSSLKGVALFEVVIDAAFQQKSPSLYDRILQNANQRLSSARAAQRQCLSTELSLWRMIWRCAQHCYDAEGARLRRQRNSSATQHSVSSSIDTNDDEREWTAVAANAFEILREHRRHAAAPGTVTTNERPATTTQHNNTASLDSISSVSSLNVAFDALWAQTQRIVRYQQDVGDAGESLFYHTCYRNFYLSSPTMIHHSMVITSLMRSCRVSRNSSFLKEYFDRFVLSLREKQAQLQRKRQRGLLSSSSSSGDADHEASRGNNGQDDVEEDEETFTLTSWNNSNGALAANEGTAGGLPIDNDESVMGSASTSRSASDEGPVVLEEIIVHTYMQSLVNASQFGDVVRTAAQLFDDLQYHPSYSVIAVVARSAGEVQDVSMAVRCSEMLFASLQSTSASSSTSAAGGGVDPGSSSFPTNLSSPVGNTSASSQKIPSNYETFCCLAALAKCAHPSFLSILDHIQKTANLLIHLTEEEVFYLKIQYARRCGNVTTELRSLLQEAVENKPLASLSLLTPRNMNGVLHGLHLAQSPTFFSYWKQFALAVQSSNAPLSSDVPPHVYRVKWAGLGLEWASGCRQGLPRADRLWIVNELRALRILSLWSPGIPGGAFRAHLALFLADSVALNVTDSPTAFRLQTFQWPTEDIGLRFLSQRRGTCIEQPPPPSAQSTTGFTKATDAEESLLRWAPAPLDDMVEGGAQQRHHAESTDDEDSYSPQEYTDMIARRLLTEEVRRMQLAHVGPPL